MRNGERRPEDEMHDCYSYFLTVPNADERDKFLHEKFFTKNMQIIFLRD